MAIRVWKGFHSKEVKVEIEAAWKKEELLILLPPGIESCDSIDLIESTPFSEKPIFGIYSSGTMGRKLILYSKANVESSLKGILSLFDLTRIDQIFSYPQPFHTFGLVLGYCQSLLYQKELVPLVGDYTTSHHEMWFQNLKPNQMTLGTPTHFKDLLSFATKHSLKPTASYTSVIGAALVESSLWFALQDKLKIARPSIGYGATEASPGITHLPPGRAPNEDGEVGFVLPHVKLTQAIEGFQFEGPNVCLALVEGGKVTFPKSITMRDELEERADGVFVYRGRKDLVLNRGGEKFLLENFETVLKRRLGIDSICAPVPDARLGEELGILACTNIQSKGQVFTVLKEVFGRDFDPVNFQVVGVLPYNSNSKLDRVSGRRAILEGKLESDDVKV